MTISTEIQSEDALLRKRKVSSAVMQAITVTPSGEVEINEVIRPRDAYQPKTRRLVPMLQDTVKSRLARIFGKLDAEKEQRSAAYITAIIPAHNEQRSIAHTLASLLGQTRQVDQIIVVVNGSTDKTAEIVRLFSEQFPHMVTCVENPVEYGRSGREIEIKSKVAALNYGWKHFVAHRPMSEYRDEYVFGLDADVVLDDNVIELLEATLDADADDQHIGGVRPVYGFSIPEETGWRTRSLIASQQIDFAGTELKDQLRRDRKVTILGGQSTLFRRTALEKVSADNKEKGPWNADSLVEDAYLTRKFEAHGYIGVVNPKAHAIVGAMETTHAWWNQRRKWQNGHLIDVASEKHFTLDRTRWGQQFALAFNWWLRVLFVTLLTVACATSNFKFNWWWLVPIGLAMIQGTLVALRMRHRSSGLIIRSATYVLPEIYTWKTLAVWLVSLRKGFYAFVNSGRVDQSDWIRQAKAESSNKVGSGAMWTTIILSVAIPIVAIIVLGFFFPSTTDPILYHGWRIVAVMSIISSLFMLVKIIRILKNYYKLSL